MDTATKTETKVEQPLRGAHPMQRRELPPLEFTPEQRKMIRDSFLNGATESEAAVLMEFARLRRLNPILRQVHFVKRYDSQKRTEVWATQVGIDGFRAIAERTGLYDGQDEPEFIYAADDKLHKRPIFCRVRIYRKDWSRPAIGVAHFEEFAQFYRDKQTQQWKLTNMWESKPHVMLAKCAEAAAHRKAFPEDTGGLYEEAELGDEREVNPAPDTAPTKKADSVAERVAERVARAKDKPSAQTVEAKAPEAKPAEAKPAPASEPEQVTMFDPDAIAEFGEATVKGRKLKDLTTEELTALKTVGEKSVFANMSASWAPRVRANLAQIDAQLAKRREAQASAPSPTAAKPEPVVEREPPPPSDDDVPF
jgi:phage recombination protein Bet